MPDGYKPYQSKAPLSLSLLQDEKGLNGVRRLTFQGKGPTHMSMVIEGPLHRWSLTKNSLPYSSSKSCLEAMHGRANNESTECRWVFFSTGQGNPRLGLGLWNFWLEVPPTPYPLRIAFYGHYGLDHETEGAVVGSIAAQLPKWTTLVSWASVWHQYEF